MEHACEREPFKTVAGEPVRTHGYRRRHPRNGNKSIYTYAGKDKLQPSPEISPWNDIIPVSSSYILMPLDFYYLANPTLHQNSWQLGRMASSNDRWGHPKYPISQRRPCNTSCFLYLSKCCHENKQCIAPSSVLSHKVGMFYYTTYNSSTTQCKFTI